MLSALAANIADVVVNASSIVLNYKGLCDEIYYKGNAANFATEYDIKMQQKLFSELATILPEAAFFGEEENKHNYTNDGYLFIIDPIDGTINFTRGVHCCGVSVGLLLNGTPIIGVVYNPYNKELFIAEKSQGAYLNGKQIHVSDIPLNRGTFLFGASPYDEDLRKQAFESAWELYKSALNFRSIGSAAMSLCDVACGRTELYFELKLQPWDYAAGYVIITEAGGKIQSCTLEGVQFQEPQSIVAYGSGIKDSDLKVIK